MVHSYRSHRVTTEPSPSPKPCSLSFQLSVLSFRGERHWPQVAQPVSQDPQDRCVCVVCILPLHPSSPPTAREDVGQTWRRLREAIFEVGLRLEPSLPWWTFYNNNSLSSSSTLPSISSSALPSVPRVPIIISI